MANLSTVSFPTNRWTDSDYLSNLDAAFASIDAALRFFFGRDTDALTAAPFSITDAGAVTLPVSLAIGTSNDIDDIVDSIPASPGASEDTELATVQAIRNFIVSGGGSADIQIDEVPVDSDDYSGVLSGIEDTLASALLALDSHGHTEADITDLGDYLPLTAGSGKPLTDDLYRDSGGTYSSTLGVDRLSIYASGTIGRVYRGGSWIEIGYTPLGGATYDALRIVPGAVPQYIDDATPYDLALDGHTHVEADITDLDKYTQSEVDDLIAAIDIGEQGGASVIPHYNKGNGDPFAVHCFGGYVYCGDAGAGESAYVHPRDFIITMSGGVASPSYSFDIKKGGGAYVGANADPTVPGLQVDADDGTLAVVVYVSDGTTTRETEVFLICQGTASP